MPFSPFGMNASRAALLEGEAVWLLTVSIGVDVLRWSSRPVDVPSEYGGSRAFGGGLDARTQKRMLELFNTDAGEPEASFNDLPAPEGLAKKIAAGAVLGGSVSECSLWVEGTVYEARDVFVRGLLSRPHYGSDRDGVAFTIVQRAEDNTVVWPPSPWVVNDLTFTPADQAREAHIGLPYSTILGTFSTQAVSMSLCLVTNELANGRAEDGLIAGGWVASDRVLVVATDGTGLVTGTGPELLAVVRDFDNLGQRISTVDMSGVVDASWKDASQHLVRWQDGGGGIIQSDPWHQREVTAAGTGNATVVCTVGVHDFVLGPCNYIRALTGFAFTGTITATTATQVTVVCDSYSVSYIDVGDTLRQERTAGSHIRGMGDVLLWILERTDVKYNRARWETVRPYLNQWKVGCVIEADVDLWNYARDYLIPLAPISITAGQHGIEPVVWRYDATVDDAIEVIRRGPGVIRKGPVKYDGDEADVRNQFKIKYAVSALHNNSTRNVFVDGGLPRLAIRAVGASAINVTTFARVARNAGSAKSQSIYGYQREEYTSPVIWKRNTAFRSILWRPIAMGYLHREITYILGQEYGHLNPGDVVRLYDDELGEDNRVALVSGIEEGDSAWLELTLQLVSNPATARRSTGPHPDYGDVPAGT